MTRMPPLVLSSAPMEVAALVLRWWDDINESTQWQDGIFYFLCAAYALVSSVALVSLSLSFSDFARFFVCDSISLLRFFCGF